MPRWIQLAGVALGDRNAATARIRDAFLASGVSITDVFFFSGVHTVFAFEGSGEQMGALVRELASAGVSLDASSVRAADAMSERSENASGTLAVTFADGDPDLKRHVPAVPG